MDHTIELPAARPRSSFGQNPWLVCLTSALFAFYVFVQMNMFNSIDAPLAKYFGLNAAHLGNLSANYFYAEILFLFPAGLLLDRFSPKLLILIAMGTAIISTALFAISESLLLSQAVRFLEGWAATFCILSSFKLAANWFPANRLAVAMGLIVTIAFLGGLVSQTPLTLLVEHLGWREALLVDAAFGVLLWFLIFAIIKDYPRDNAHQEQERHQELEQLGFLPSVMMAVKNRQNWLAGIYTGLMNSPIAILGGLWGMPYLEQVQGLSPVMASYVTSMLFIGAIIGSPLAGLVSDKLGLRRLPMLACSALSCVVAIYLVYGGHQSFTMLLIVFFLLSFITSAQVIPYPAITESNPLHLSGTAIGLAATIIMGANALFQPLFGWLMDLHWDHAHLHGVPVYSAANFKLGMMILPISFIVAIVTAFIMRETYCRRLEQH